MAKKLDSTTLRHRRIRKTVQGTTERPRLAVHFSGSNIYALVSANTTEKEFKAEKSTRANTTTAVKIGKLVAERAKGKNIELVVFDRGGFLYHGKVKALADAAREGGLQF